MGNDAVDCVRKEGGCNTQTDMISRLVLFFFSLAKVTCP